MVFYVDLLSKLEDCVSSFLDLGIEPSDLFCDFNIFNTEEGYFLEVYFYLKDDYLDSLLVPLV